MGSSLAHCITLADLHPVEAQGLKDAAKVYREEGFPAREANKGAVKDAIKALEAERRDILGQIKKQKPEYFEKPEPEVKDEAQVKDAIAELAEKPKEPVAEVSRKQPWETSDLANRPNIPGSYVQAKKQPDGKYKLFFTGTTGEVFEGEVFTSAPEARQFFKVQQVKAQEAIKTKEKAKPKVEKESWGMTQDEILAVANDPLNKTLKDRLASAQWALGVTSRGRQPNKKIILSVKRRKIKALEKQIAEKESNHKTSIQEALRSGELTPENYAELHAKDYGPLEEFMPEIEKEPVLREPEAPYVSEPFMYSALTRAAESKKIPEKMFAAGVINRLRKAPGVKQAEIDAVGFVEWLEGKKIVTKRELVEFLKMNEVRVEEVGKRIIPEGTITEEEIEAGAFFDRTEAAGLEPKFAKPEYRLPGGEPGSYRELVLKVTYKLYDWKAFFKEKGITKKDVKKDDIALLEQYNEWEEKRRTETPTYRGSHWDEPNVIAHIRGDARIDADGKKRFHVAEFQSDLHSRIVELEGAGGKQWEVYDKKTGGQVDQFTVKEGEELEKYVDADILSGKDKEYAVRNIPSKELANLKKLFPWGENWHELVSKKALEYAIRNNFDGISWDTGKTQVDRWESALRKSVDKINWTKAPDNQVWISGEKNKEGVFRNMIPLQGGTTIEGQRVTLNNLIGKELANKIRESSENSGNFEGKDLTLGGEFFKIVYDQKIPGFLRKYGKKWGAKVEKETVEVKTSYENINRRHREGLISEHEREREFEKLDLVPIFVHTMDITPAMRQSIQAQGQTVMEPTGEYRQSEIDIAFGGKKKADEAIEAVAKEIEAVSLSRRGMPDRVAGAVPESGIAKILRKKNRLSFVGTKLTEGKESEEIAELFQAYRSPKMEILHAIHTDADGTILAHNAITSGHIGYVVPGKPILRYFTKAKFTAKRLGADKVHFLHNHPSGNHKMSKEDVEFARTMDDFFVDQMGEFVVIDHGKYSWLSGVGVETGTYKIAPGTGEWMARKGPRMKGPGDVAAFGQSLAYDKAKVCFIYVDSGNNIQGWSTHDNKILEKSVPELEKIVRQHTKGLNARKAVIIADDMTLLKPIAQHGNVGDWLLDLQDAGGESLRQDIPEAFDVEKEPLRPSRGLFEPGAKYDGKEVIGKDGTTVDWKKTMTLLKQKVYGTYKKDGSFDKWRTRTEISKIKALQKAEVKYKERLGKAKEKFEAKVDKIKTAKEILQRRRGSIRAIKEYFNLSDNDLRKISRKDIRLMSDLEFKKFKDGLRVKAEKFAERRQAMNELQLQIQEKELNVENLRKAMKLPTLKNMTVENIRALDEALRPFQEGDVFLSLRKLETVDRTELKGIKTWREARERLAKKLSIPVGRLQSIKVAELDRFRYDTGLAERNPFYRMMVEETAKRMLVSEAEYLQMEKDVFAIAKKLRPKGIIGRLIPQQKKIRAFMETPADQESDIDLTEEELALVEYMTKHFAKAREYLIQIEAMKMGRENYFTHVRRGPLEAIKEDGIIKAVKEMFEMYKLDEQGFTILDRSTGEILALDKFFKFAMHRVDKIKPTENVIRAFLIYMKTFKKKQALDEIVPLIDIYAHSLTPSGSTKKGLFLDANLIKFTREWLNTQKGRHITTWAKQNGKIDAVLRAIKMFTSLRDLGLNIPVSIATEVGEQITTYQLLGKKSFALGKVRQNTKQGKAIIEKYRSLIGKNPWAELVEPSKEIGNRLMEGIFVMFRDASVRANKTFLLGSLSKEEFDAGEISPGRLAALRTELGRYRMVQGMTSIIGATPEGQAYTQYKKWAIPILRTTVKNLGNLGKKMVGMKTGSGEFKKSVLELYRLVEITAFVMLMFGMVRDEDDESFTGKIMNKAYREATTLIQALQPKMFMAAGRTASFIEELGVNLTLLLTGEEYKTTGKLKGVKKLERQVTPVAISQFKKKKKPKSKKPRGLSSGLSSNKLSGSLK